MVRGLYTGIWTKSKHFLLVAPRTSVSHFSLQIVQRLSAAAKWLSSVLEALRQKRPDFVQTPVRTIGFFCFLALCGCGVQRTAPSPYLHPIVEAPPPQEAPAPRPVPPPRPSSPNRQPLVYLDPGHGGDAIGAQNKPRRLQEKRLTLDIARRTERLLAGRGYSVRLSRTKDVAVSLQKRVLIAERRAAAVFVSIHINSSPSHDTTGAEVFYYAAKAKNTSDRISSSKRLGTNILNALCRTLPTANRGLKDGDFYVIRETTMPSVLVEVAFITNPHDAILLASAS